ncbi:MAG: hypothetical protein P9L94_07865 [Candidatus Hinthialibacter antarcticus]|nr:hypothetical protein [Candidatus Hinthialibacter antarcticus]
MSRLLLLFLFVLCFPYATEAKVPAYSVDEHGVHIEGVDGTNPVIYDNDWWNDVFDSYYVWAQAHLGAADLRGNIITRDMWDHPNYLYPMQRCVEDCNNAIKTARSAGWENIPNPVLGAEAVLHPPESLKIEETKFTPNAGSRLIVSEANQASKEKPLVIIAGGPLTTVAIALLDDPTISDKMIVFNLTTTDYGYNGKDGWSAFIVAKRGQLVEWGGGDFWDKNSVFRPEHFDPLPGSPVTKFMKEFIRTDLGAANQMGDGAALVWMYDNGCWTGVEERGAQFKAPAAQYRNNGGQDVLVIPKQNTGLNKTRKEFLRVLGHTKLYKN